MSIALILFVLATVLQGTATSTALDAKDWCPKGIPLYICQRFAGPLWAILSEDQARKRLYRCVDQLAHNAKNEQEIDEAVQMQLQLAGGDPGRHMRFAKSLHPTRVRTLRQAFQVRARLHQASSKIPSEIADLIARHSQHEFTLLDEVKSRAIFKIVGSALVTFLLGSLMGLCVKFNVLWIMVPLLIAAYFVYCYSRRHTLDIHY